VNVGIDTHLTAQYASAAGKSRTSARVKAAEALEAGEIDGDAYQQLLRQDLVWKKNNEVSTMQYLGKRLVDYIATLVRSREILV
jgi:hypothetical protein